MTSSSPSSFTSPIDDPALGDDEDTLKLQLNDVNCIILVSSPQLQRRMWCAKLLHQRIRSHTQAVTLLSQELEAKYLRGDNVSGVEGDIYQDSATSVIISRLHAMMNCDFPPLFIILEGLFTTEQLEEIFGKSLQNKEEMSSFVQQQAVAPFYKYESILLFSKSTIHSSNPIEVGKPDGEIFCKMNELSLVRAYDTLSWCQDRNNHMMLPKHKDIDVTFGNLTEWKSCSLDESIDWILIGCVMGCYSEFCTLLTEHLKWKITGGVAKYSNGEEETEEKEKGVSSLKKKSSGIILVGDFAADVDGNINTQLLTLLENSISAGSHIHIVPGQGDLSLLQASPDDKTDSVLFRRLMQKYAKPFLQMQQTRSSVSNNKYSFIVTNSPCDKRYLCRLDEVSIEKQISLQDHSNYHIAHAGDTIATLRSIGYINQDTSADRLLPAGRERLSIRCLHYTGSFSTGRSETYYHPRTDALVLLNTIENLTAVHHASGKHMQVVRRRITIGDSAKKTYSQPDVHVEDDGTHIAFLHPLLSPPSTTVAQLQQNDNPARKPDNDTLPPTSLESDCFIEQKTDSLANFSSIIEERAKHLPNDRVDVVRVINPRGMPVAPARAGEVESIMEMIIRLRGTGASQILVHNIPAGVYIDLTIELGVSTIMPEMIMGHYEYEFCKQIHQKMELESISNIIIRAVYEDLRTCSDFKMPHRHIQHLLSTGAEKWAQELTGGVSLGRALELHKDAMQEVARVAKLERRGMIHPFEILSIRFHDGSSWSAAGGMSHGVDDQYGKKKMGKCDWDSPMLRYKWLSQLETTAITPHYILNLGGSLDDLVADLRGKLADTFQNGLGMFVRPEVYGMKQLTGFRMHSKFGLMQRYGALFPTNEVYRRVLGTQ